MSVNMRQHTTNITIHVIDGLALQLHYLQNAFFSSEHNGAMMTHRLRETLSDWALDRWFEVHDKTDIGHKHMCPGYQ